MSNNQYSWADKFPTLTELFFGKGNGPQGPLNGMTVEKPKKKATSKKVDISKSITAEKPIKEVTEATSAKVRGTNKDLKSQVMLKKLKTKKT